MSIVSRPDFGVMVLSLMQAIFKPPKPIRGGIPICFPQVWASQPSLHDFLLVKFALVKETCSICAVFESWPS